MGLLHTYSADLLWTGAGATTSYTAYSRNHEVRFAGKPVLLGSSDASFRGDPTRHNPEELLVAALAQCHLLWFLHLAAAAGVVVTDYTDQATGTMRVEAAGHGQFTQVVLRPQVTVAPLGEVPALAATLLTLHERAHEHCFISRSVNFPVRVVPAQPTLTAATTDTADAADRLTQEPVPPRGAGS